jgi:hypothetical protein
MIVNLQQKAAKNIVGKKFRITSADAFAGNICRNPLSNSSSRAPSSCTESISHNK